jgi:hypothetical protein
MLHFNDCTSVGISDSMLLQEMLATKHNSPPSLFQGRLALLRNPDLMQTLMSMRLDSRASTAYSCFPTSSMMQSSLRVPNMSYPTSTSICPTSPRSVSSLVSVATDNSRVICFPLPVKQSNPPQHPYLPGATTTTSTSGSRADGRGHKKYYINQIQEFDVIGGRGGRSNHHAGNKRYRQVINEMKAMYRNTETKAVKTDLSRLIVDHVCAYGGRFVKSDPCTGQFYVLTRAEARKKTSQALRETKELKWTI